jgi:hypothetical protein
MLHNKQITFSIAKVRKQIQVGNTTLLVFFKKNFKKILCNA